VTNSSAHIQFLATLNVTGNPNAQTPLTRIDSHVDVRDVISIPSDILLAAHSAEVSLQPARPIEVGETVQIELKVITSGPSASAISTSVPALELRFASGRVVRVESGVVSSTIVVAGA
jgi:hypothetical protein